MSLTDLFHRKYTKIQEDRSRLNLMAKNGFSNYVQKATDEKLDNDELIEKVTLILNYFDPGYLEKLNNSKKTYDNLLNYKMLKSYLYNNENWKNYTHSLKPFEFDNLAEAIFKYNTLKLEPDIDMKLIPDYRNK